MTRTQLIGAITDLLVAGQKRTALQLRNLLIDIVNNVLCPADNGNVGIGTSSPSQKLQVDGSIYLSGGTGTGVSFASDLSSHYLKYDTALNGLKLNGYAGVVFETLSTERMRIDASGNVGIGTTSPTEKIDIQGDAIRLRTAKTPASATATGTQGQVCWDSNYVYVCVATNTWKRAAISTW